MVLGMLGLTSAPARAAIEPAWVDEPMLPEARIFGVVVADDAGLIYVCGGTVLGIFEDPVDTAFAYDSNTGDVSWLPSMPVGVRGGTGAVGEDGRVYVFTGYNDTAGTEVAATQIYNPANGTWTLGADIPVGMWGSKAQLGWDGRIYVLGGSDSSGAPLNAVQIYDPEDDSWSAGASMPYGVYHGVAVAWSEYIFYIGGMDSTYAIRNTVIYYSVTGDYWSTYSYPAPVLRWGAAGCLGEDDLIYYVGGNDGSSVTQTGGACLNIRTSEWVDLPEMSSARFYYGVVPSADGRIMAVGGSDWTSARDSVESLDVSDVSVGLSSDTVDQGGSVMLSVGSDFAFTVPDYTSVWYFLKDADGVVYMYDGFNMEDWAPVTLEVSISENLPAGDYTVVVYYYLGEGWNGWYVAEGLELALTVVDAPTVDEQIAMLEERIAELQAELADLADEMNASDASMTDEIAALRDQIAALEDALEQTNTDVGDVQSSVDDKLSAMMGYMIIGLLIVVIVLLLLVMMKASKSPPPPPPPAV